MRDNPTWTDPKTGKKAGYINGKLVCTCGMKNGLTLLTHGAAPLIDSEGPWETYGIWECRNCGKKWMDTEEEFEPYEEGGHF